MRAAVTRCQATRPAAPSHESGRTLHASISPPNAAMKRNPADVLPRRVIAHRLLKSIF